MKQHRKKMVAPIIISLIVIIYYIVYFGILISLLEGVWKYLLAIFPILLAALMIWVCFERIKEIRTGEEDDLSKY